MWDTAILFQGCPLRCSLNFLSAATAVRRESQQMRFLFGKLFGCEIVYQYKRMDFARKPKG